MTNSSLLASSEHRKPKAIINVQFFLKKIPILIKEESEQDNNEFFY
jgi:hypothetical protein